jgi:hypothetical protein
VTPRPFVRRAKTLWSRIPLLVDRSQQDAAPWVRKWVLCRTCGCSAMLKKPPERRCLSRVLLTEPRVDTVPEDDLEPDEIQQPVDTGDGLRLVRRIARRMLEGLGRWLHQATIADSEYNSME